MLFNLIIGIIGGVFLLSDPFKREESALHLLQLEEYNPENYVKWLEENPEKLKGFGKIIPSDKTPLVMTDRAKRLKNFHLKLNLLIVIVIIIIGLVLDNFIVGLLMIFVYGALYYLQPKLMVTSGKRMLPKEKEINLGFYKQAQNKIGQFENLKVVGITGSYGKTSTKFITSTILKEKYNVQDTPSSYNTPMGLSKVINNDLKEDKDIFIAEMGAYKKGEIKEVADLVQPDIGVLTSIGPAHLESFGSIKNIISTKYELIESLESDGIAIFNYDDENLKEVAENTELKKLYYGLKDIEKLDVYAKEIKVSERGSDFILGIKEKGEIQCNTKLLGRHNISNLLAGASVAHALGLSLEEIKEGIYKVEPVEHRLNIIDPGTGIVIIDDGFNSNPAGAKAALEVIDEFKSGNKFIVTPGMIELGELEFIENKKFGKEIGKVADYAFLVGKKRTKPIKEGLLEVQFPEEKIFSVDSLEEATGIFGKMIRPGDVILFENDLPDNYSEED